MNRNCSVCNIKIHKKNYLKDSTVCKNCYNKNRRKNNHNVLIRNEINNSHQQPKIENVNNTKNNVNNPSVSTYENHTYVVIGPKTLARPITC